MAEVRFVCSKKKTKLKIAGLVVVSPSGNLIVKLSCPDGNKMERIITQLMIKRIAQDNAKIELIDLCGFGCQFDDEG